MPTFVRYVLLAALFIAGPAFADDPPEDPPTEPVEEEELIEEEPVLNLSQEERIRRLAEASGSTEEDILAMRNGSPIGEQGEALEGRTTGWGVIAKMLGLHPGVLGHGTGDKFYPPEEAGDGDLPPPPELDDEALNAFSDALDETADWKEQRRSARDAAKLARAENRAERKANKQIGKANKPDRPDNAGKKSPRGNGNTL